ncbi:MAG: CvpA family protein [Flavobacteriales bacterium]|nr:CvpA family protein [Flavobacteriales bacterium]
MNWLDAIILLILALAAWKGFSRGFVIELASLVGIALGAWAGLHLSERVTAALELEVENEALAFLITFVLVLLLIHLLARLLTTVIDIAQLSLPNKLAGILFGVLRSAFVLSIALNLMLGFGTDGWIPDRVRSESVAYPLLRPIAPAIIPALQETKWVRAALERAEQELNLLTE